MVTYITVTRCFYNTNMNYFKIHCVEWGLNPTLAPPFLLKDPFHSKNQTPHPFTILANFQISERGTNERKKFKKRNIPKFPIHYYTKIAAKTGTHDKIILFFASKRGTVPPKEEQLASMFHLNLLLVVSSE